jgi:hypothetical protein
MGGERKLASLRLKREKAVTLSRRRKKACIKERKSCNTLQEEKESLHHSD